MRSRSYIALLEHFPTNLAHRDCVRKPLGKERRAVRAGSPFRWRDAASVFLAERLPDATQKGRAAFGPSQRCQRTLASVTMGQHSSLLSPRALSGSLGPNRLRHGEPDWSESACLMTLSSVWVVIDLPGPGWPPRSGRKGTDRETPDRLGTGLEYDRPFLFLQARTDAGVLDTDDKHGTSEKMSDNLPQTIGIDISKASLDCHVHPVGAERQFANTATKATRR